MQQDAAMTESPDDLISITMPARVWNGIYGEVDNTVNLAAESGEDDQIIEIGAEIMETRVQDVPGHGDGSETDKHVSATLTRAQWRFILDHVRESTPIYEYLDNDESVELGRLADAVVSQHLGVQPHPPTGAGRRPETPPATAEDLEQLEVTFSMGPWSAVHSAMENASQEAEKAKDFHAAMAAGELLMAALDSFHTSGIRGGETVIALSRGHWRQMATTMTNYEAKVRDTDDEDWLANVNDAIDLIRRALD